MSNDLDLKKYGLTAEKLSLVASALRDVRNETLALYDPLGGDDAWSHGVRVYSRSRFRIKGLSTSTPWLTVVEEAPKPRFTFAIDGVPIRFYRGSPDDPPSNYLVVTYGELAQRQLFNGLWDLDKILRIAIETDAEGRVSTAKLVELDEAGNTTGVYLIPFDLSSTNVVSFERKPIDVGAPAVEPIETEAEKQEKIEQQRKKK